WNTDMDTQDSEGEYTAQAIIDEYGLEIEWQSMRGMGPNGPDRSWRVVGKWEKKRPRHIRLLISQTHDSQNWASMASAHTSPLATRTGRETESNAQPTRKWLTLVGFPCPRSPH